MTSIARSKPQTQSHQPYSLTTDKKTRVISLKTATTVKDNSVRSLLKTQSAKTKDISSQNRKDINNVSTKPDGIASKAIKEIAREKIKVQNTDGGIAKLADILPKPGKIANEGKASSEKTLDSLLGDTSPEITGSNCTDNAKTVPMTKTVSSSKHNSKAVSSDVTSSNDKTKVAVAKQHKETGTKFMLEKSRKPSSVTKTDYNITEKIKTTDCIRENNTGDAEKNRKSASLTESSKSVIEKNRKTVSMVENKTVHVSQNNKNGTDKSKKALSNADNRNSGTKEGVKAISASTREKSRSITPPSKAPSVQTKTSSSLLKTSKTKLLTNRSYTAGTCDTGSATKGDVGTIINSKSLNHVSPRASVERTTNLRSSRSRSNTPGASSVSSESSQSSRSQCSSSSAGSYSSSSKCTRTSCSETVTRGKTVVPKYHLERQVPIRTSKKSSCETVETASRSYMKSTQSAINKNKNSITEHSHTNGKETKVLDIVKRQSPERKMLSKPRTDNDTVVKRDSNKLLKDKATERQSSLKRVSKDVESISMSSTMKARTKENKEKLIDNVKTRVQTKTISVPLARKSDLKQTVSNCVKETRNTKQSSVIHSDENRAKTSDCAPSHCERTIPDEEKQQSVISQVKQQNDTVCRPCDGNRIESNKNIIKKQSSSVPIDSNKNTTCTKKAPGAVRKTDSLSAVKSLRGDGQINTARGKPQLNTGIDITGKTNRKSKIIAPLAEDVTNRLTKPFKSSSRPTSNKSCVPGQRTGKPGLQPIIGKTRASNVHKVSSAGKKITKTGTREIHLNSNSEINKSASSVGTGRCSVIPSQSVHGNSAGESVSIKSDKLTAVAERRTLSAEDTGLSKTLPLSQPRDRYAVLKTHLPNNTDTRDQYLEETSESPIGENSQCITKIIPDGSENGSNVGNSNTFVAMDTNGASAFVCSCRQVIDPGNKVDDLSDGVNLNCLSQNGCSDSSNGVICGLHSRTDLNNGIKSVERHYESDNAEYDERCDIDRYGNICDTQADKVTNLSISDIHLLENSLETIGSQGLIRNDDTIRSGEKIRNEDVSLPNKSDEVCDDIDVTAQSTETTSLLNKRNSKHVVQNEDKCENSVDSCTGKCVCEKDRKECICSNLGGSDIYFGSEMVTPARKSCTADFEKSNKNSKNVSKCQNDKLRYSDSLLKTAQCLDTSKKQTTSNSEGCIKPQSDINSDKSESCYEHVEFSQSLLNAQNYDAEADAVGIISCGACVDNSTLPVCGICYKCKYRKVNLAEKADIAMENSTVLQNETSCSFDVNEDKNCKQSIVHEQSTSDLVELQEESIQVLQDNKSDKCCDLMSDSCNAKQYEQTEQGSLHLNSVSDECQSDGENHVIITECKCGNEIPGGSDCRLTIDAQTCGACNSVPHLNHSTDSSGKSIKMSEHNCYQDGGSKVQVGRHCESQLSNSDVSNLAQQSLEAGNKDKVMCQPSADVSSESSHDRQPTSPADGSEQCTIMDTVTAMSGNVVSGETELTSNGEKTCAGPLPVFVISDNTCSEAGNGTSSVIDLPESEGIGPSNGVKIEPCDLNAEIIGASVHKRDVLNYDSNTSISNNTEDGNSTYESKDGCNNDAEIDCSDQLNEGDSSKQLDEIKRKQGYSSDTNADEGTDSNTSMSETSRDVQHYSALSVSCPDEFKAGIWKEGHIPINSHTSEDDTNLGNIDTLISEQQISCYHEDRDSTQLQSSEDNCELTLDNNIEISMDNEQKSLGLNKNNKDANELRICNSTSMSYDTKSNITTELGPLNPRTTDINQTNERPPDFSECIHTNITAEQAVKPCNRNVSTNNETVPRMQTNTENCDEHISTIDEQISKQSCNIEIQQTSEQSSTQPEMEPVVPNEKLPIKSNDSNGLNETNTQIPTHLENINTTKNNAHTSPTLCEREINTDAEKTPADACDTRIGNCHSLTHEYTAPESLRVISKRACALHRLRETIKHETVKRSINDRAISENCSMINLPAEMNGNQSNKQMERLSDLITNQCKDNISNTEDVLQSGPPPIHSINPTKKDCNSFNHCKESNLQEPCCLSVTDDRLYDGPGYEHTVPDPIGNVGESRDLPVCMEQTELLPSSNERKAYSSIMYLDGAGDQMSTLSEVKFTTQKSSCNQVFSENSSQPNDFMLSEIGHQKPGVCENRLTGGGVPDPCSANLYKEDVCNIRDAKNQADINLGTCECAEKLARESVFCSRNNENTVNVNSLLLSDESQSNCSEFVNEDCNELLTDNYSSEQHTSRNVVEHGICGALIKSNNSISTDENISDRGQVSVISSNEKAVENEYVPDRDNEIYNKSQVHGLGSEGSVDKRVETGIVLPDCSTKPDIFQHQAEDKRCGTLIGSLCGDSVSVKPVDLAPNCDNELDNHTEEKCGQQDFSNHNEHADELVYSDGILTTNDQTEGIQFEEIVQSADSNVLHFHKHVYAEDSGACACGLSNQEFVSKEDISECANISESTLSSWDSSSLDQTSPVDNSYLTSQQSDSLIECSPNPSNITCISSPTDCVPNNAGEALCDALSSDDLLDGTCDTFVDAEEILESQFENEYLDDIHVCNNDKSCICDRLSLYTSGDTSTDSFQDAVETLDDEYFPHNLNCTVNEGTIKDEDSLSQISLPVSDISTEADTSLENLAGWEDFSDYIGDSVENNEDMERRRRREITISNNVFTSSTTRHISTPVLKTPSASTDNVKHGIALPHSNTDSNSSITRNVLRLSDGSCESGNTVIKNAIYKTGSGDIISKAQVQNKSNGAKYNIEDGINQRMENTILTADGANICLSSDPKDTNTSVRERISSHNVTSVGEKIETAVTIRTERRRRLHVRKQVSNVTKLSSINATSSSINEAENNDDSEKVKEVSSVESTSFQVVSDADNQAIDNFITRESTDTSNPREDSRDSSFPRHTLIDNLDVELNANSSANTFESQKEHAVSSTYKISSTECKTSSASNTEENSEYAPGNTLSTKPINAMTYSQQHRLENSEVVEYHSEKEVKESNVSDTQTISELNVISQDERTVQCKDQMFTFCIKTADSEHDDIKFIDEDENSICDSRRSSVLDICNNETADDSKESDEPIQNIAPSPNATFTITFELPSENDETSKSIVIEHENCDTEKEMPITDYDNKIRAEEPSKELDTSNLELPPASINDAAITIDSLKSTDTSHSVQDAHLDSSTADVNVETINTVTNEDPSKVSIMDECDNEVHNENCDTQCIESVIGSNETDVPKDNDHLRKMSIESDISEESNISVAQALLKERKRMNSISSSENETVVTKKPQQGTQDQTNELKNELEAESHMLRQTRSMSIKKSKSFRIDRQNVYPENPEEEYKTCGIANKKVADICRSFVTKVRASAKVSEEKSLSSSPTPQRKLMKWVNANGKWLRIPVTESAPATESHFEKVANRTCDNEHNTNSEMSKTMENAAMDEDQISDSNKGKQTIDTANEDNRSEQHGGLEDTVSSEQEKVMSLDNASANTDDKVQIPSGEIRVPEEKNDLENTVQHDEDETENKVHKEFISDSNLSPLDDSEPQTDSTLKLINDTPSYIDTEENIEHSTTDMHTIGTLKESEESVCNVVEQKDANASMNYSNNECSISAVGVNTSSNNSVTSTDNATLHMNDLDNTVDMIQSTTDDKAEDSAGDVKPNDCAKESSNDTNYVCTTCQIDNSSQNPDDDLSEAHVKRREFLFGLRDNFNRRTAMKLLASSAARSCDHDADNAPTGITKQQSYETKKSVRSHSADSSVKESTASETSDVPKRIPKLKAVKIQEEVYEGRPEYTKECNKNPLGLAGDYAYKSKTLPRNAYRTKSKRDDSKSDIDVTGVSFAKPLMGKGSRTIPRLTMKKSKTFAGLQESDRHKDTEFYIGEENDCTFQTSVSESGLSAMNEMHDNKSGQHSRRNTHNSASDITQLDKRKDNTDSGVKGINYTGSIPRFKPNIKGDKHKSEKGGKPSVEQLKGQKSQQVEAVATGGGDKRKMKLPVPSRSDRCLTSQRSKLLSEIAEVEENKDDIVQPDDNKGRNSCISTHNSQTLDKSPVRRSNKRRSLSLPTGTLAFGEARIVYKNGHFTIETMDGTEVDSSRPPQTGRNRSNSQVNDMSMALDGDQSESGDTTPNGGDSRERTNAPHRSLKRQCGKSGLNWHRSENGDMFSDNMSDIENVSPNLNHDGSRVSGVMRPYRAVVDQSCSASSHIPRTLSERGLSETMDTTDQETVESHGGKRLLRQTHSSSSLPDEQDGEAKHAVHRARRTSSFRQAQECGIRLSGIEEDKDNEASRARTSSIDDESQTSDLNKSSTSSQSQQNSTFFQKMMAKRKSLNENLNLSNFSKQSESAKEFFAKKMTLKGLFKKNKSETAVSSPLKSQHPVSPPLATFQGDDIDSVDTPPDSPYNNRDMRRRHTLADTYVKPSGDASETDSNCPTPTQERSTRVPRHSISNPPTPSVEGRTIVSQGNEDSISVTSGSSATSSSFSVHSVPLEQPHKPKTPKPIGASPRRTSSVGSQLSRTSSRTSQHRERDTSCNSVTSLESDGTSEDITQDSLSQEVWCECDKLRSNTSRQRLVSDTDSKGSSDSLNLCQFCKNSLDYIDSVPGFNSLETEKTRKHSNSNKPTSSDDGRFRKDSAGRASYEKLTIISQQTDVVSSNSNDSGIQRDVSINSSNESLKGTPEAQVKLRRKKSTSPCPERPKSEVGVRWADQDTAEYDVAMETPVKLRNRDQNIKDRPRPKSDFEDHIQMFDELFEEVLDDFDTEGSCFLSDRMKAFGSEVNLQPYCSLRNLYEMRRRDLDKHKNRRMSTPHPIKSRHQRTPRKLQKQPPLVRSSSMPESLEKIHKRRKMHHILDFHMDSLSRHVDLVEDSMSDDDDSDLSFDHISLQEKSLSIQSSQSQLTSMDEDEDNLPYAEALWDHITMDPEELGFRAQDLIEVLDMSDKDWWFGAIEDREGWFPAAFVRLRVNQDQVEDDLDVTLQENLTTSPTLRRISMINKNQARTNVVNEIINAEREYVKHLKDVVEGYIQHARKRKEMFPDERIALIFGNIETIYTFACKFLAQLEECIDVCPHLSEIGQCFLNNERGFEIYSDYCNNHPSACEELKDLCRDSKYKHFFEACRLLQELVEIPLEGFLLTPVQKICKYPLQLAELLKYTPPEHADYVTVRNALAAMRKIATLINERKRKMESIEKIAAWQQTVVDWEDSDLLERSSELIFSGEMNKVNSAGWSQERYFFLFDHQLIYCKKELLKRHVFSYKGRIDLDQCELVDVPDGKDVQYNVTVKHAWKLHETHKDKWYLLYAKTDAIKDRWKKALQDERKRVREDQENDFCVPEHWKQTVLNKVRSQSSIKDKQLSSRTLQGTQSGFQKDLKDFTYSTLPRNRHSQKQDKKKGWFIFGGGKKTKR